MLMLKSKEHELAQKAIKEGKEAKEKGQLIHSENRSTAPDSQSFPLF